MTTSTIRNNGNAFGRKQRETGAHAGCRRTHAQKSPGRVPARPLLRFAAFRWNGRFSDPVGEGRRRASPHPGPHGPSHSHTERTDHEGSAARDRRFSPLLACSRRKQGAGRTLCCGHVTRQGFDSRNGVRPAEHVKPGCHWEPGSMAALSPPPQLLHAKFNCFHS